MTPETLAETRKSLHRLNNDLAIASIELELISLKLQKQAESVLRNELLDSCRSAVEAVQRAGRTAHDTLHTIQD